MLGTSQLSRDPRDGIRHLRSLRRGLHHWSKHHWHTAPGKPPADAASMPANRRTCWAPAPAGGLRTPAPKPCSSLFRPPPLVEAPVAHRARQTAGGCCQHAGKSPGMRDPGPGRGLADSLHTAGSCLRRCLCRRCHRRTSGCPSPQVPPTRPRRNFGSSGRTLESDSTPHAPSPQPPLL